MKILVKILIGLAIIALAGFITYDVISHIEASKAKALISDSLKVISKIDSVKVKIDSTKTK